MKLADILLVCMFAIIVSVEHPPALHFQILINNVPILQFIDPSFNYSLPELNTEQHPHIMILPPSQPYAVGVVFIFANMQFHSSSKHGVCDV